MATPREELSMTMRKARLEAGFDTHKALARALGMTRPAISRAESPRTPIPSITILDTWARGCRVPIEEFLEIVERIKNGAPDWFGPWLEAEAEATRIQIWEPAVFPGLLQVEAYIRALGEPESAVTKRMGRKHVIGKATITAVLRYSVFDLDFGGPAVMAEACGYVADLAEKGLIHLHVVPDTARVGLGGALAIATKNGHSTVSLTTTVRDITSTAADLVDDALAGFDRILGAALPAVESLEFVRRKEAAWKERS